MDTINLIDSSPDPFLVDTMIGQVPDLGYNYVTANFAKQSCGMYYDEIHNKAEEAGIDPIKLLAANVYYDVITAACKADPFGIDRALVPGCTTYAYNTPGGPVHGRNLDWYSDNNVLSDYSIIATHKDYKDDEYSIVTWPGLTAAYTAIKPGAYSISINSVVSEKPVGLGETACPIALRSAMESCENYREAVVFLSKIRLFSDCMFMVVGTKDNEMCVIERTPRRVEVRHPENGILVVTNDYRVMDNMVKGIEGELDVTTCSRYDRAVELLNESRPTNIVDNLDILQDEHIKMCITAQHVVMHPSTGALIARAA
jgi:hypothetical protein